MAAGGEGGEREGYEFGVDPNLDPELAMALRVSLEEERARQIATGGGEGTIAAAGERLTCSILLLHHCPVCTGTAQELPLLMCADVCNNDFLILSLLWGNYLCQDCPPGSIANKSASCHDGSCASLPLFDTSSTCCQAPTSKSSCFSPHNSSYVRPSGVAGSHEHPIHAATCLA